MLVTACRKDLLEAVKSRSGSGGSHGEVTVSSGGIGKTAPSTRPKKTKGASLVNPNTKR